LKNRSENLTGRGQISSILKGNSSAIARESGGIWIVQADLQPISFKSDRLLGDAFARARMNRPNFQDSTMAVSIKDSETDSKIRELSALTGESITVAVRIAIEQRLRRESSRRRAGVATRLLALSLANAGKKRFAETANEAIGYDAYGLPK